MSEKLSEHLISELNKILVSKLYLKATSEYLNVLLDGTSLKKSMLEINGVDTAEREMFLDLLSFKLTGSYWPDNSEPKELSSKFIHNFIEKAGKENGLNFVSEKEKEQILNN